MESEGGKMSKNEIAVREHFLPSAFQNKDEAKIRVFVEYEKINDAEYAFISRPDQDTEIRIVPGAPGEEQGGTQTDPVYADAEKVFSAGACAAADDIVDVAFDEFIPEKERRYYSAALACGLLCGALNEAPSVFSGFNFDEIESFELLKPPIYPAGRMKTFPIQRRRKKPERQRQQAQRKLRRLQKV